MVLLLKILCKKYILPLTDIPEDVVKTDIKKVREYLEQKTVDYRFEAAMAIGYSIRGACESMSEIIKLADQRMYEDKDKFYKEKGLLHRTL